jgi:GNAT superfamily N-acetyltransferase
VLRPSRREGIRRLVRRGLETLRNDGLRALIWQTLAVAGVRRLTVVSFPLDDLIEAAAPAGVGIRTLSPADVRAYHDARPDTSVLEVEQRLGAGEVCVAGWREERLIAGFWLATKEGPVPYLGLSIPPAADAWWAYDAFVTPEERGRGVLAAVRAEALRRARSGGAAVAVGAVLSENRAGMGLARRWRRLGTLVSIRLGPLRLAHSTVPPKYLGRPRFCGR